MQAEENFEIPQLESFFFPAERVITVAAPKGNFIFKKI